MTPTAPPERPTIPAEPTHAADDQVEAAGPVEAEGRGVTAAESKPATRTRRKRAPVSTETKGRKLHLPDDVHDRLWLLARQRRTSVSTVAAEILDRNLPRFRVEREG